jgi:Leucine-rich repeat (LRR) protein
MPRIVFLICLLVGLSGFGLAQDESQTPYDIALERILEAERTNATNLRLDELQLTELPPEIGNLNNLQRLWLDSNQLSSLPPEIGNLTNLQTLYLQENQLSSLPSEIGNLTNLQTLYLQENQLSSLPSEIGNLNNLCRLHLASNQLQHLPTEIEQLTRLSSKENFRCSLNIGNNPLISPSPEVIALSTPTLDDYYDNPGWWYFRFLFDRGVATLCFRLMQQHSS